MRGKIVVGLIIILAVALFLLYTPYAWRYFYPLHHEEIIFDTAEKYELDPYLIFSVIRVESKFKEDAVSKRGAVGLMQVMPSTGKWIAKQASIGAKEREDLIDPEINIEIGCWYLNSLKEEYEDLVMTLAAYNAGPGKVKNWLELGIWEGSFENIEDVPYEETREYVRKVLRTYEIYKEIY